MVKKLFHSFFFSLAFNKICRCVCGEGWLVGVFFGFVSFIAVFCLASFSLLLFLKLLELLFVQAAFDIIKNVDKFQERFFFFLSFFPPPQKWETVCFTWSPEITLFLFGRANVLFWSVWNVQQFYNYVLSILRMEMCWDAIRKCWAFSLWLLQTCQCLAAQQVCTGA